MNYQPEYNTFNSSILAKNPTYDYLQSKNLNKSELGRTQKQSEFEKIEKNKFSESQSIPKSNIGAISNLGIYQNKTFYNVNQPKRAGTTLTTYQEESKRKRAIKKLVTKINTSSTSNSNGHPLQQKDSILPSTQGYKSSVKGNEKIFLPIYEVLNQARIDQKNKNNNKGLVKKHNALRKF